MGKHEESIASWYTVQDGEKAARSHTGTASWWELRAEVGGVLIDASHHASAGARAWTTGNAAVRIASEIVLDSANRGEPIPALAFRSHVHRSQDSGTNVPACRCILTPAWQARTAYGYRIAARPADVGGVLATVGHGEIDDVRVVKYRPEKSKIWRERE